ncbi:ATP-binding protein [Lactobacillus hominis]|uniref:ATP-binding protein n=1 Tax=Lactobacillus hominis TaxID=1203033 RepID=UPI0023F2660E|nr:ATP-binding protein [Lactobacillus hominis]
MKKINKILGVIVGVDGNISQVGMYSMSNESQFLWNGELLQGPKVGALLTILQDDIKIIAKVVNEKIMDQQNSVKSEEFDNRYSKNSVNRIVNLRMQGVIENNSFKVTSSYVPMIGNEVTITSKEDIDLIYGIKKDAPFITVGKTIFENKKLNIPINEVFASHIGIFGNTGSGKSNTLHMLYTQLFNSKYKKGLLKNSSFFIFDFNGEYRGENIFGLNKNTRKIINLNTRAIQSTDKIMLDRETFLDSDILSMLFDAKKGVQAPFIKKAIKKYKDLGTNGSAANFEVGLLKYILRHPKNTMVEHREEWINVLKNYLLSQCIKEDYVYKNEVLNKLNDLKELEIKSGNNWKAEKCKYFCDDNFYYNGRFSDEAETFFAQLAELLKICFNQCSVFTKLRAFLEFQLIFASANNNNLDYLRPLFDRATNVLDNLELLIEVKEINEVKNFYKSVNIISFLQTNLTVKRIVPMLISKMIYNQQKNGVASKGKVERTTHLIIDEAHNILGTVESKSDYWQNKRLVTFEEIIKEGRKFGFFLTIASQRPADISPTIMSQLHNFFIHRLINEKDLAMIENTMPTLDRTSFGMIPSLGQGETVLTGKAFPISIFAHMYHAKKNYRPKSDDILLTEIWDK